MVSYLKIGNHDIPVKIIQEWRMSTRVALGKDHVILRIPKSVLGNQVDKHLYWAENWLKQVEFKKPDLLLRYVTIKKYYHGSTVEMGLQKFQLIIAENFQPLASIKLINPETIQINLPSGKDIDHQKVIKHLLTKFSCKYFLPALKKRVAYLNDQFFKQEIKDIKLKYNKSNWGSCSRDRNLNFSVRLFLAPQELLDYVIVHELAHLLEMNHSQKFWKIVEGVIPEYKKYEKLLKVNSHLYDF